MDRHQILAPPGQDSHHDFLDIHTFRFKQRVKLPDPVPLVQQIVHQNHAHVKGLDRPHLIDQLRIIGVFLNGKLPDARIEIFLRMKGLRHRIWHRKPVQNLPERHAHQIPENPGSLRLHRHLIDGRNHADELVMYDLLIYRKYQRIRIHHGQGLLKVLVGPINNPQYIFALVERVLDLRLHVLNDHHRKLHVHGENHIVLRRVIRPPGALRPFEAIHPLETLPFQSLCHPVGNLLVPPRVINGIGEILLHALKQGLTQQQLKRIPDIRIAIKIKRTDDHSLAGAGLPQVSRHRLAHKLLVQVRRLHLGKSRHPHYLILLLPIADHDAHGAFSF